MFIHDFVHVEVPIEEVLGRMSGRLGRWVARAIRPAFAADVDEWVAAGLRAQDFHAPVDVVVQVGSPRMRFDGVVVPLQWPPGPGRLIPGVEADFEVAACGPHRSDIQIMGRYYFLPGVDRWSDEGSLAHRVTVGGVRRVLGTLRDALEAASPMGAASPPR